MCGIIGVTGRGELATLVLQGLEDLEYRGYDSAGVVFSEQGSAKLELYREAERGGSVGLLRKEIEARDVVYSSALGHTRWATHGAPTRSNAHPHLDCTGQIAVVHNGIIENYRELWAGLSASGHLRRSETDSEVIAHLLEEEAAQGSTLVAGVAAILPRLRGDFAIVALSSSDPSCLVAARRSAPLICGLTSSLGLVGSDIGGLARNTRELYELRDGEIAEIGPGSLAIFDHRLVRHAPVPLSVPAELVLSEKSGYPDFMSKEMADQRTAVTDTLAGRLILPDRTEFEELGLEPDRLRRLRRIVLLACGSSFHAGLVGRHAIESLARLTCDVEVSSEFRYRCPVLDDETLVIGISQSGETVDTLHGIRQAKRAGAVVVGLTNVVGSLMAREADGVLYTRAGPEVSVASTKCHLAQIALLEAFALHLGRIRQAVPVGLLDSFEDELYAMPDKIGQVLARSRDYSLVGDRFASSKDFYFLGRRVGYPIALEGALKLKELSYLRAEAYPAGEMKHGPISLIEGGAIVVAIATGGPMRDKVLGNVAEVRARGATIVLVVDDGDGEVAGEADAVLEVPPCDPLLAPLVAVPPLQYVAYAIARRLGNDVDRPRNLAKVVTVE